MKSIINIVMFLSLMFAPAYAKSYEPVPSNVKLPAK